MRNRHHPIITRRILPLALGAVVSLAFGQAIDLGCQTLGSGPGAAAPIIGDTVGLLACATGAFIAFRQLRGGALGSC